MRFLLCAAITALLAAGPAAGEDKMYKWVDEDGNVTYQDRPPPEESGQGQTFSGSADTDQAGGVPDVALTLYSIEQCATCDLVRKLLNERGLPFTEKNVEGDVEVQAELKELAGVVSVPVLAIGDQVLTGYNRDLIIKELDEAGFPTSPAGAPVQAQPEAQPPGSGNQLTREDLEAMTPEEIGQAARDAALRGEHNELFDEDEGFLPNEDTFYDSPEPQAGDESRK
ncbi:MAG: glutaredoxin family protein [Gammaproteobacteria bacterium]|nr:glutaredoxin family protein [Gammaproteobacteria bacterium]